jgi:hypothetical protein
MDLLDAFNPEEQELIRTPPSLLTPVERARRYLLFIRPIPTPFQPGQPPITHALVLSQFGVRGGADELATVLRRVHEEQVDFRDFGGTWAVARRTMNVLLTQLKQSDLYLPPRDRSRQVNFAQLLFRNFDGLHPGEWEGFGPNDLDEITARFIEVRAPEDTGVIPQAVRARLPQGSKPTIIVNPERPRVEVRPPAPRVEYKGPTVEQVREAVQAGVKEATAELPEQFEAAFVRAIARGQAFIPAQAPPPPAPVSSTLTGTAPVIPPLAPPSPAEVAPPSEALGGAVQQDLFGGQVRRSGVGLAPVQLAERQLADKYRPLFIDQVLGSDDAVATLRSAAQTDFLPSYIAVGPPGVGKTSAVLAAVRTYLLRIEASYGHRYFEDNYRAESATFGIDPQILHYENAEIALRRGGVPSLLGRISAFQRQGRLVAQARKFLILDDVTKFNEEQQKILLPLTERYPRSTVFFIANDANYSEALLSRSKFLRFQTPDAVTVEARLLEIMRAENMQFPDNTAVAQRIVRGLGLRVEFRKAVVELAAAWSQFQTTGKVE